MTVGIIAKLRRGFEDVGRKGIYRPTTFKETLPGEAGEASLSSN
jgi:hypothetical protein